MDQQDEEGQDQKGYFRVLDRSLYSFILSLAVQGFREEQ